jgi:hypothetical protein
MNCHKGTVAWDGFLVYPFPYVVERKNLKNLSQITPIFQIRVNTFRVFSEYAERMKNTQKEIFTFNNAWGLLRGSILKKWMWGYILAQDEHFTYFSFWISLKQKLLSAQTENTLNGKISTESVYILVNDNTSF